MAELNRCFNEGRPSQDLARSGVLVRQFDGLSDLDNSHPWMPCPRIGAWCSQFHAQWPTSIINRRARATYFDDEGGMVLDASTAQAYLRCIYPGDGNSMARTCGGGDGDGRSCIPGCAPDGEQCHQEGWDGWGCSYPPPLLEEALRHHERDHTSGENGQFLLNNELILDPSWLSDHLPGAVLAFFHVHEKDDGPHGRACDARARYLRTYRLEGDQVPLLHLDLSSPSQAFQLRSEGLTECSR